MKAWKSTGKVDRLFGENAEDKLILMNSENSLIHQQQILWFINAANSIFFQRLNADNTKSLTISPGGRKRKISSWQYDRSEQLDDGLRDVDVFVLYDSRSKLVVLAVET
jgi:hypothetical protein